MELTFINTYFEILIKKEQKNLVVFISTITITNYIFFRM